MGIGDNIKKLRTDSKLTQKELAEIIGINYSVLSRIESNERTPRPDELKKIADYFKTDLNYLMDYEVKNPDSEIDPDLLVLARNAKTLTKDQLQAIKRTIDAFKKANEED